MLMVMNESCLREATALLCWISVRVSLRTFLLLFILLEWIVEIRRRIKVFYFDTLIILHGCQLHAYSWEVLVVEDSRSLQYPGVSSHVKRTLSYKHR